MLMGTAVIPLLTGCVSHRLALAAVGPDPNSQAASTAKGNLEVFTATQKSVRVDNDDNLPSDLPTGYDIYDASGNSVRYVANHGSNMDEWPDRVSLPAGEYKIVAESTWCGLVTVPLAIQNGKTTTVHLDDNWFPSSNMAQQLVFLPNGEAVGWSTPLAAQ